MKRSSAILAATAALVLAATSQSASAITITTNYFFSGNTPQGHYAASVWLRVSGNQAFNGGGTLVGLGLGGPQHLALITPATPGANYPGPSVGFRANDGTDLFGCDTAYPIDGNCLLFAFAPVPPGPQWGQDALFAIWWDAGSATYQDFFAGRAQPGQPNMYFQTTAIVAQPDMPAPEPMTLALFGAGLAGLGALRRRKQVT